jgi:drug/metabolite transporter (DMT)-like permease
VAELNDNSVKNVSKMESGMLHQASGRWKLGLVMALITAACWASLPLVLKVNLAVLDPITLTWARFLFAAVFMLFWLSSKQQLGAFRVLDKKRWQLMLLAAMLLAGNYVGYLLGVQFTSPSNAQLLIQMAPLLMAMGGVFIFKEAYALGQWLGLSIIVIGLLLFFRDQLDHHTMRTHYYLGVLVLFFAAVSWAGYAPVSYTHLRAHETM